ncbi:hypothetical protein [Oscillibacter sp.]|uniref:hypothetical protein n=1 Tax=Oscillibacter sp. TaxID=1945593 RepID=UPI0026362F7E|nr:hypothetical protein [Oscillibacter sp.]MDD3346395.1 hypothetical protein [Oscillibacter sp.]
MTLIELSFLYADSAAIIYNRMQELRRQAQQDLEHARALERRIEELLPLWRDMRDMTRRTAHYYDRRRHG